MVMYLVIAQPIFITFLKIKLLENVNATSGQGILNVLHMIQCSVIILVSTWTPTDITHNTVVYNQLYKYFFSIFTIR